MPYISFQTNIKISSDQELILKEKFGKAIENLTDKTENWLMVCFQENMHLYFAGKSDSPIAYIKVSLYGVSTKTVYNALTMSLTKIVNDTLNISPDKVYVNYEEAENWGWNGSNF